MIKNYIFDFGNVLAEFVPDKLTKPYVGDAETRKLISDVVFDRLYWDRLDDGTITDDEVKAEIRKRVPDSLGDIACRVYDGWICNMTALEGMTELVHDLKNNSEKLYLVSNISKGFADNYKSVKWIDDVLCCFDGLVFSGVVGKVKPDREIFEHLLGTYNLKPEECLFIDDSTKNIEGAAQAGIRGYLFDGDAEKLRKALASYKMAGEKKCEK